MAAAPAAFARAPHGVTPSERDEIAGLAANYMAEYGAPGLSVAIAHRGQLAYAEGFGFADPAAGQRVAPPDLFRIASVSKPVTSVAVFSLIEQGRLTLTDKVFGRTGILRNDYGTPKDRRIEQITIEQLLTHTCGGWPNKGRDPMFSNPDFDQRRLIAWTLANVPLDHAPGTAYAYSNFGYCLLGRVIEKLTGQRYGAYVREAVLKPCGVTRDAHRRRAAHRTRGGRGGLCRAGRRSLPGQGGAGGLVWRLDRQRLRPRAVRDACRRRIRHARHPAAGHDRGDDHAVRDQSPVTPRAGSSTPSAGGTTAACRAPRPSW